MTLKFIQKGVISLFYAFIFALTLILTLVITNIDINEDSDQLLFVPSSFSTGNNIGFKPQSTQRQQQHHPCTVGNLDLRIFRPDIPFKVMHDALFLFIRKIFIREN